MEHLNQDRPSDLVSCNEYTSFALFLKFPSEIRCNIWKQALIGPHTHIIAKRIASRSRITEIMQSCKEAYDEGIRLHFSHFTWCNYKHWQGMNCHAPLPKHYMNPNADTMWIVENDNLVRGCFPFPLSLYDGYPSYRMVKTLVVDHRIWREPSPLPSGQWQMNSLGYVPYQMCEEIFIVLNEVALSMNHEVTFVEPVEKSKEPFSSRNLTSQGFLKPNSAFYKEAKKREKVMKNFLKAWQRDNNDDTVNDRRNVFFGVTSEDGLIPAVASYPDLPVVRYVIAKQNGRNTSFTYIKKRKPIASTTGGESLSPFKPNALNASLMFLANTNRDHTWLTKVIDANQGRSNSEDFSEDGLGGSSKYENQHEDDDDDDDHDDDEAEYKVTDSDDEVEEPLEFDSEHEDEEEKETLMK